MKTSERIESENDSVSNTNVARSLTWRYVIALFLVASLSTAAWLSLHLVIAEQESTAAVVNVSGRQRMLSQRTALFSNMLVNAPKTERPLIRDKLKDAIQLMELSHHGLTHGNSAMGLPPPSSPAVRSMYFDGPNGLDEQVESYVSAVKSLLKMRDDELTLDKHQVQYITQTASTTLVAALDGMVHQYQVEGEASVRRLEQAETLFWGITLMLLTLEAALIFHPFVKHVRSIIGKLQDVKEELQLHQSQLEETVRQRTAELEEKGKILAESEEKFRLVSTEAKDAIAIIGQEEQIIYWNPAAERIFGYTSNEAMGENLHALLSPSRYRDTAHSGFEHFKQYGVGNFIGKTLEFDALHRNGGEFPIELSISAFMLKGKWHALGIIRDITERKQAEMKAAALIRRNQVLMQSTVEGMHVLDDKGNVIEANDSFCRHLGYAPEEILQLSVFDFEAKLTVAELQSNIERLLNGQAVFESVHRRKDGTLVDVEVSVSGVELDGQKCIFALSRDITVRKRAEESLHITASVFANSQEAILITDANNNILDVNPAFTGITGYSREEVMGKNPRLLSSGRQGKAFYTQLWKTLEQEGNWRGEIWNRRKSGEVYAELLSISAIRDEAGMVQRYVAAFSDISHIKEHEAELSRVAHYDALTGIPNRVLLADRLQQAIAQTSREQGMMAVCYLDLDGFKPINDTMGHEAGDQMLIEVARRIGNTIRGGDTVARLGGDEFVVLLLDLEKGEECVTTLERLLNAIAQPITFKNKASSISASIGVSIYPLDHEDPDTLLRHADQAMYVAKQSGRNRFHIYDSSLDRRARDQREFLKSIRYGLEHDQFELHYQPKVNLRTRELIGAEALIRWRHPERGLLPPAEFLRQIENTELDIELGEWVIVTALTQLNYWRSAGLDIEVSINISGYHLESTRFDDRLLQQLALCPGLPPGRLQIEILETVALGDIDKVRKIIESCRKIGVGFALDDFGTGYSSLMYLSNLSVDVLKIDQTFVRDMLEDKGDMAIVQGIIALARAFDRKTVAEGIETEKIYEILLDMGCEIGQGYFIARPMPANELMNFHF